ncbi:MAG: M48 family metalloprotease [Acidimicrobiia bacterium]
MVLHESAIRRNRRRIVALAILAVVNYWLAAIVFVFCVVVGSIVALVAEGFVEGLDFNFLAAFFRALPDILGFFLFEVFTSPMTAVVALAFVLAGSVVAAITLLFRLGRIERRVLRETGATVAPPGTKGELENLLSGLAISADVPPPRFAVIEDPAPNAFAVGRRPETAIVAVTRGLLDTLSRNETEAILSYEISRIASRDIALSTWAVAVTGHTIELWENTDRFSVTIGLWVPKLLAQRLRAFALRGQAAQQDMLAVRFTRNPRSLLDALVKLQQDGRVIGAVSTATAPLWLEYPGRRGPTLDERITTLRELLRDPPQPQHAEVLSTEG